MIIHFNSDVSIYIQLVDIIKHGILNNAYKEEAQIPSTTEVSTMFQINPATVLKAYNILVDEGIVYKKRGMGMFVSDGAKKKLASMRKVEFCDKYVESIIHEAKMLGIKQEEVIKFITEGWDNEYITH